MRDDEQTASDSTGADREARSPRSSGVPNGPSIRLGQVIDDHLAEGWRIESQTATMAVLVKGKRPNHILHLILSIVTLGLWLIIWANVVAWAGERQAVIRQYPDGRITKKAQPPGPLKTFPGSEQEVASGAP